MPHLHEKRNYQTKAAAAAAAAHHKNSPQLVEKNEGEEDGITTIASSELRPAWKRAPPLFRRTQNKARRDSVIFYPYNTRRRE